MTGASLGNKARWAYSGLLSLSFPPQPAEPVSGSARHCQRGSIPSLTGLHISASSHGSSRAVLGHFWHTKLPRPSLSQKFNTLCVLGQGDKARPLLADPYLCLMFSQRPRHHHTARLPAEMQSHAEMETTEEILGLLLSVF